jgi:hypothetical protein
MDPFAFFWLWVALAAVVLLISVACTASENGFWSFVAIGVYLLGAQFCGALAVWDWIRAHPWHLVGYAGVYVLLGCGWAVVKWWRLCRKLLRDIEEVARRNPSLDRAKVVKKWQGERGYNQPASIPPRPGDYASRITNWIACWPLSLLAAVFGDFLVEFFRVVYERLAGVLQSISNSVFAGFADTK